MLSWILFVSPILFIDTLFQFCKHVKICENKVCISKLRSDKISPQKQNGNNLSTTFLK